jgi:HAD superfamily phosphatase (TIGR01668 family)
VVGVGLRALLTPDATCTDVTAISAQGLRRRGIRALVVDLDNTLSPWNDPSCAPRVAAWLRGLQAAGIAVCIVSNNGPERVRAFLRHGGCDLPWVAHAGKPGRRAYRHALQLLEADPAHTAAVGDQLFTDVLGGKRAGLLTILVTPLARREFPLTRLLRLVEGWWLRRLESRGALHLLQ